MLVFTLVVGGCATTKPRHQWTEDALHAETAQLTGDLDGAERAYETLLPEAPTDEKRRWLRHNIGLLAVQRGDATLARLRFAEVYEAEVQDEHGANSMYEVAKLASPDSEVESRLAVCRRFPNQVAAEFALQDVVSKHLGEAEHARLQSLLVALLSDVDDTELADNVWFSLAQLRYEHLKQPDEALSAYRELFKRFPKSPLADDALWEMANIYRAHQMWDPALVLLAKLADEVEASWFIGSYESDWVDNAIYDAGWIELVYQSDYAAASKWFKRYLKKFSDGLLNDDAAWNLVQAKRLVGDDAVYQRALEDFVEEYPESRYVRRLHERGAMP